MSEGFAAAKPGRLKHLYNIRRNMNDYFGR